ncbi:MAG: 4Fe-4S binding protein, partial [Acidobacteriaceae bacterium]
PGPTATPTVTAPAKKPFIRRHLLDHSQPLRHAVQIAFLALNAWLGLEFILWVRYYESNGHSFYIDRPAGVEGWLPIAGLMNLKYFLITHHVSKIHPAAMILLVIFLLSSFLLKKSFCSWLCPVGTASEYLWHLGQKVFHRSLILPRWLDIPLRSLKYLLLAFFVYVVATLSADGLQQFLLAPFGIIADVKMLNFFRHMGTTGIAVILTLVLLSLMIQNVWCRFLCPYGALMGLVSLLSPIKIRRDEAACAACNKCNQACPSHLPVAQLITIRSAECTGCLSCIASCPAENALNFAFPPHADPVYIPTAFPTNPETSPAARSLALSNARWHNRALQPRTVIFVLAILFFGLITFARTTHHWQTNLPRSLYQQLVPHADDYNH